LRPDHTHTNEKRTDMENPTSIPELENTLLSACACECVSEYEYGPRGSRVCKFSRWLVLDFWKLISQSRRSWSSVSDGRAFR
jgi:hypothetical protein